MICSQCGLPLTPKRNSCPRCGTPVSVNISNQTGVENPLPINAFVPDNLPTDQIPFTNPNNPVASTQAANMYAPPMTNWHDGNNFQNSGSPNIPPTQIPFSAQQMPQLPFLPAENWQSVPPTEFTQQANREVTWTPSAPVYPTNDTYHSPGQPPVRNPHPSARNRSERTRIGFTIAGLCIITGSLLLVFVYFMGQGFLPDSNTSNPQPLTTVGSSQTATVTQVTPSPTPPVTPTPILPGQSLLDTSMLSRDFKQIQPSTAFKVNQKIFVILTLHPGGHSHAVCLSWYLNNRPVNNFAFEVNPAANYNYYSYTIMPTPGKGSVDISLASTTACADEIMAQTLSFTVTA